GLALPFKGRVVGRIEAVGDAPQAGLSEQARLLREERPVRSEREVEVADRRQLLDETLVVAPHKRLAPRQADLPHTERDEDAHEPLDLLERQDLRPGQELEILAADLFRHAV